ncbi:aromatic ring-hydroxylating dioxygenase subunit alpha [Alteraurantiacibacter buctensis]|uniref:Rieske 2Fe-2S domain-containing protein n=1 Tax=Alteraurantiacibacter buctensis TaxID=1503981 RepID=A0A844YXN1_9SPHN|nr:aromatic ring-hydroxylating dioxygenase subunit alpha [Alteraurantiacibacter buctensis]MXO71932.1 Rieske 2Fe-2S domain-containing protein [Alteraurantiacibacter buctensis]
MPAYVRNLWYMAAWEHEVPDGGMLSRKLLDQAWLVHRLESGAYAMLEDRCPHRFVPLSMGRKQGDVVHCRYHGLGFGPDGACVHTPFPASPPGHVKAATMPVVARYRALWFWPGDPALADPSLIPDFAFLDSYRPMTRGHLVMQGNYELVTDNLMDLTHAEFLHVETFGVNGSLFESGAQTVQQEADGAIWNKWTMTDARAPAWAKPVLGEGARVDQKLHMRWHAPASMALLVEIGKAGTAYGVHLLPPMLNPHIITPETQGSSHYFYDHEPTEQARDMAMQVFVEEDEPMIEAAQAALGETDFWDARPAILKTDAAAIRCRRALMQLRRREAGEAEAP